MSSLAPLTRRAETMLSDARPTATLEVDVTTLDRMVPEWLPEGARPALKVDTQGTELEVLRGGRAVIDRFSVLVLELSPWCGSMRASPIGARSWTCLPRSGSSRSCSSQVTSTGRRRVWSAWTGCLSAATGSIIVLGRLRIG